MILSYFIVILMILFIDFIWLYINRSNYNNLVKKIQGSDIQLNLIGTGLSYLCVFLALFMFTIPMINNEYEKNKNQSLFLLSVKYGGTLGLIIYGVINATNIAIFKNYDVKIAIMDTIWGFVLYTSMAYLFIKLDLHIIDIKNNATK